MKKTVICPVCRGSGRIPRVILLRIAILCPRCHGRGVIEFDIYKGLGIHRGHS